MEMGMGISQMLLWHIKNTLCQGIREIMKGKFLNHDGCELNYMETNIIITEIGILLLKTPFKIWRSHRITEC